MRLTWRSLSRSPTDSFLSLAPQSQVVCHSNRLAAPTIFCAAYSFCVMSEDQAGAMERIFQQMWSPEMMRGKSWKNSCVSDHLMPCRANTVS
jgi:hypothetical protein